MNRISIIAIMAMLVLLNSFNAEAIMRKDRYFVTGEVSSYSPKHKEISIWDKKAKAPKVYKLNKPYPGVEEGKNVFLVVDVNSHVVQHLRIR